MGFSTVVRLDKALDGFWLQKMIPYMCNVSTRIFFGFTKDSPT